MSVPRIYFLTGKSFVIHKTKESRMDQWARVLMEIVFKI
jgi:hypothetical protein